MVVHIRAWWRSLEHSILWPTLFLLIVSAFISFSYSPKLGLMFNLGELFFAQRHIAHVICALLLIIFLSYTSTKNLLRLSLMLFGSSCILLFLTLSMGTATKGSLRWINILGASLQPSEQVRSTLPAIIALLLTRQQKYAYLTSGLIVGGICLTTCAQPDIGMAFLILSIYFAQIFITAPRIKSIIFTASAALAALGGIAILSPHARARLQTFLHSGDATTSSAAQIHSSIKSFVNGSLFGIGPGEGAVKDVLPDVHCDFILCLISEEFGSLFCVLILSMYLMIIQRSLSVALYSRSNYITIMCVGSAMYFGSQCLLHTASVLNILPPKGTTLPFVSYGGSSLLGAAWVIGSLLNISRKHIRTISL